MVLDTRSRDVKTGRAVNLGLASNVFLAILKTLFGIVGNSPALLADGLNSTSDVAQNLVVSIFMRLSHKPPDIEHPYGHRQFEDVAALVVGAFVVTTGIAILWDSLGRMYAVWTQRSNFEGAALDALAVALFTVLLKLGLTFYTRAIGLQTRNPAIQALAYDHRNDVFAALAVSLGILVGRSGLPWVDPLAGAVVSIIILGTGIEILRGSSRELMGSVPSEWLSAQIQSLLDGFPGVEQVEEIHAHRFGPYLVVNLTIGIEGSLTVSEGDRIASQVEDRLLRNIEYLSQVHIHYHPSRVASAEGKPRLTVRSNRERPN